MSIGNWIKEKKAFSWKFLKSMLCNKLILGALIFLLGAVFTPIADKVGGLIVESFVYRKSIVCTIDSITKCNYYELDNYSKQEKIKSFKLNLDDNIITDYTIAKVILKNKGGEVKEPIKFFISINNKNKENPYKKIIEIIHKIKRPKNRLIPLTDSIPILEWTPPSDDYLSVNSTIRWNKVRFKNVGYDVYGSFSSNKGYGKINSEILDVESYPFPFNNENGLPYYIKVLAVSKNGVHGMLSEQISVPYVLAFRQSFKDTIWVDYESNSTKVPDGSEKKPFKSINEAVDNATKSSTFIVKQERGDKSIKSDISNVKNILFSDDFKFLTGECELFFPKGIDKKAEIELFLLIKTVSPNLQLNFKLVDPLGIEFKQNDNDWSKKKMINLKSRPKKPEALLIPKMVIALPGQEKIILTWGKSYNEVFDSVRIFRSDHRKPFDLSKIGNEIYDGKVMATKTLTKITGTDSSKSKSMETPNKIKFYMPPSKEIAQTNNFIPIVPKIELIEDSNPFHGKEIQYYEDDNVESAKIYTYTLYFYNNDNKNRYSCPVIVNAQLEDDFLICKYKIE